MTLLLTVYEKSPATNDFDIVRFCKRSVYERRLCEQIVSASHSLVTALARLEKLDKEKHNWSNYMLRV